jgi:hypothetical protein
MEIQMRDQSLRFSVNGCEIQNVTLNQHAPLLKNPARGLGRFSGRVGLLKRTGEVRFRNIEIQELLATRTEATPAAHPADSEVNERVAADQTRHLWLHDHGYFIRGHGNDWFEKHEDGNKLPNLCHEVQRTKELVELRHYFWPITFRLYKGQALIKDERTAIEFRRLYEGEWEAITK